ncbi:MAG: hypothetical protein LBP72_11060, partial [Dysgonamonadaceae bacterium]|nr:hypothetical protein [Dysgonamonadaceae bacterium]
GWGLAPYARYSFVEFGKFSVWGSAALAFGGGETGVGDNTEKFTAFGLDIHPVLKYDLSDKFTLLTNLNFLNIGFTQVNVKDAATVTNFGLGVDAGDVATLGAINIGFLYKF